MRKGIVIATGAALLIGAGAWYWGSPAYAMSQLRDAAIEGDAAGLEARVDFPAVRASLKEQLRAELASQIANTDQDNGFAAFGSMLAMGMVDGMVEGFVNAESVAAMVKRGQMQRPAAAPSSTPTTAAEPEGEGAAPDPEAETAEWAIERDGLSRFTATPQVSDGQAAPTMVFERDGLGWKLTEIDIPAGAFGAPAGES